jgi:hypothetical protein
MWSNTKEKEDDNDQDARVHQEYSDSEDEIVEDQHTNKVETNLLKIGTPAMFDENLGEIVS